MLPRRAVAALLAAALLGVLGGCGDDSAADRASERAAYARQVSTISTAMERRLAELSDQADYRRAAAAAASTRSYASSIRAASSDLGAIAPPEIVTAEHRALVRLYGSTAVSLDALAQQFAAAPDAAALGVLAQELSSAIQQYASREQELRAAIQRALASGTSPTS